MEVGKVYTHKNTNILLYSGDIDKCYYLGNSRTSFEFGDGRWDIHTNEFTEATLEEEYWIKQCIEHNKFIPEIKALENFEKNINYEVY